MQYVLSDFGDGSNSLLHLHHAITYQGYHTILDCLGPDLVSGSTGKEQLLAIRGGCKNLKYPTQPLVSGTATQITAGTMVQPGRHAMHMLFIDQSLIW